MHVDMEDHRNEEYVKPKAVLKAFSGEGRKLGRFVQYEIIFVHM